MQNKIPELQIHDIKPLLEIHEYSLYYFIGVVLFSLILISSLIYFLVKYLQSKNNVAIRKEHFTLLDSIQFSDAKKAAYDITLYGSSFKKDSQKHTEMFENLTQRLEIYKYKKNVANLDNETKAYFKIYKDMIDV